jgi:arylsulfatase A
MTRSMNRRHFLGLLGTGVAGAFSAPGRQTDPTGTVVSAPGPNIVLILCDNLGYGDLSCLGSVGQDTPNIDRLAREGMCLTSFYSSSPVCTPSRASLMTGCYAQRVDMHLSDSGGWVLQPVSGKGLNPSETTIAEILRGQGYATACLGKWHLGDQPEFLPTRHGFDDYLGIPYSEDMVPAHTRTWPPLPLMRNEAVIEAPVDLTRTTRRYVTEAVRFIRDNCHRRFFLYFAHHLPGSRKVPDVDPEFRGESRNGLYGDSVQEIDWSVGEIMAELRKLDLDHRTLVLFTSDNGTPRDKGGSNAPWGGWAYSTSEGGMRMPCMVRWPGQIPAGKTCSELCTMMDLLPTLTRLAGGRVDASRVIDGKDIWNLWVGAPGAESPHEAFYYYMADQLQAVRCGLWKLHLPLETIRGRQVNRPLKLIDLGTDPQETTDLSRQHPDIVQRLLALARQARNELGDLNQRGRGRRPAGRVNHPTPRVLPSTDE